MKRNAASKLAILIVFALFLTGCIASRTDLFAGKGTVQLIGTDTVLYQADGEKPGAMRFVLEGNRYVARNGKGEEIGVRFVPLGATARGMEPLRSRRTDIAFEDEWQSFRTEKDRTLELMSVFHE